ncbi:Tll0287-like domain-containing protein [Cerasicoccus maritimus]|uniref:Tll0287-like domain-containing protein n=1 Tax=Cerasicoccus maritimus TaxID=490089 RepID=UPI0028529ECE|nr:DUF3365 domain-containing protein [Cerasicoccus maritimus]
MKKTIIITIALGLSAITGWLATGCSKTEIVEVAPPGVSFEKLTDALHMVLENDRTVYTQKVVNRLVKEDKVIKASEHWSEDQALPLPAQMFRMGAELTASKDAWFSYSLQSLWPINKSNAAGQTEVEKKGLEFVAANGGAEPFYGQETLGGQNYFTAVYADVAVAPVCVSCHNEHKDSPKTDFKLGDVMGGVVIRIPMDS